LADDQGVFKAAFNVLVAVELALDDPEDPETVQTLEKASGHTSSPGWP